MWTWPGVPLPPPPDRARALSFPQATNAEKKSGETRADVIHVTVLPRLFPEPARFRHNRSQLRVQLSAMQGEPIRLSPVLGLARFIEPASRKLRLLGC